MTSEARTLEPTPDNTAISPEHSAADWQRDQSVENAIDIWRAQVLGWRLNIAKQLEPVNDAGFAILSIVAGYFEMVGKARTGTTTGENATEMFVRGIFEVFGPLDPAEPDLSRGAAEAVYDQLRCALYHDGITGRYASISGVYPAPIAVHSVQGGEFAVAINPFLLVDNLVEHFEHYIARLRNPANEELRENFFRWFTGKGETLKERRARQKAARKIRQTRTV